MGVYLLIGALASAYFIQKFYRHYLRKSALVYMKTKGDVDLNSLLTMPPTDSVYKILYNVDSHIGEGDEKYWNRWDHIVFAHCFPDDETRNKYMEYVRSLEFVEDIDVVVMVPWYFPAHIVFNLFIRVWRVIGGFLGKLPSRPLEKSTTPAFRCSPEAESDVEPVVLFNVLNITDNDVFGEYAKIMFTVLFPVVNANVYYTANPAGDRWNEFSMVTYETHSSSCELCQSVIFEKNVVLKRKSVADTYTHVARRLSLPKKKEH